MRWISQGQPRLPRPRRLPRVSSTTLRSLQMTSGLFNTGVAGDSSEVTSYTTATAQPSSTMLDKFAAGQDDFLADTFDTSDFDMDMFGDLGGGFDPLGDDSLDSFTDLTAFLSQEAALLDQMKPEELLPLPDLSDNVKDSTAIATTSSLKRSFDEMEAGPSDLDTLSARVGVTASPTLDHDYSSKRPRMSAAATEAPSTEEVFLAPAPLPTPSTSYVITVPSEDKTRNRREKNNIASKRSREIRKKKFVNMEAEAEHLVADNARLEKRVAEMEKLAQKMKEILVAKMAGK